MSDDLEVRAKTMCYDLSGEQRAELAANILNSVEVSTTYDDYKVDKFVSNLFDRWKELLAARVSKTLR